MNHSDKTASSISRRRVNARSAFFLLMITFGVMQLQRAVLALLPGLGGGVRTALAALCTVCAFGLPAYAGVFVVDGDQRAVVPRRALSRSQLLDLVLLGVLMVCPASLLSDMQTALAVRAGWTVLPAEPPPMALFLPMLLQSVLLAPLCEEAFFRGYLLGVLRVRFRERAVLLVALVFALSHGVNTALLPRLLLGLLLGRMTFRTGSILAPAVLHAAYNFTLLVLSFSGLEGVLGGTDVLSCLLRLLGSAVFVGVFRRACVRPMQRELLTLGMAQLSRRDRLTLLFSGAAVLAALIVSGVSA